MAYTPEVFDELVRAYLSTGAGVAGMQPKIMILDIAVSAVADPVVVRAMGFAGG